MALAKAISRSEYRRAQAKAGVVSALEGTGEALLLSAQGEADQVTADASEAGLISGLTMTAAESGRMAGACAVVAGAGLRN